MGKGAGLCRLEERVGYIVFHSHRQHKGKDNAGKAGVAVLCFEMEKGGVAKIKANYETKHPTLLLSDHTYDGSRPWKTRKEKSTTKIKSIIFNKHDWYRKQERTNKTHLARNNTTGATVCWKCTPTTNPTPRKPIPAPPCVSSSARYLFHCSRVRSLTCTCARTH